MGKIIFIVQHLGQPRCIKRIKTIKEAGFNVEIFGMDWGVYSDNIKLYGDITIRKIVKTKGLSKIQKIKEYYSLVKAAEKAANKGDIMYAFGFEMATMVHYFTKKQFVYELADVVAAREDSKILKYIVEFFCQVYNLLFVSIVAIAPKMKFMIGKFLTDNSCKI